MTTAGICNSFLKGIAHAAIADNSDDIASLDGLVIASPGDFLGYEVAIIGTESYLRRDHGHIAIKYEKIPVEDILRYVEALEESPYFEFSYENEYSLYAREIYFTYTGSSPEITPTNRNLGVFTSNVGNAQSEFYVYQYEGFTIANVSPSSSDDYVPFEKDCSTCNYSGRCRSCNGREYTEEYKAGYEGLFRKDCPDTWAVHAEITAATGFDKCA